MGSWQVFLSINSTLLPDVLKDVEVEFSALSEELEGARERGVLWQAAGDRFQIDVPDTARFRVECGRRITIQPAPGCTDQSLAQILRMTPLAALLYQRGLLALHAAVVAPPPEEGGVQRAVLLAGDSGAGKSVLAAALLCQGWSLLSDDLAILGLGEDRTICAWPLPGPLALWPLSAQKLGLQAPNPAEPNERVWIDFTTSVHNGPLPLAQIYTLAVSNVDRVEVRPIASLERFAVLGNLTYHSHIADALLDRKVYLNLATQVVRSAALRRLTRPRGKWSLVEMVEKVTQECIVRSPDKD